MTDLERPAPRVDVQLSGDVSDAADEARGWGARGAHGAFTFEGPRDVFLALAGAATSGAGLALYSNVAIAFPRSPMHLAQLAWDLQRAAQGRFALGLGSQVRAHVERRFGSTWDAPVGQMREWVEAIRAIFARWQDGTALDFEGRWTTHTLMPPLFDPGPLEWGPPPIWVGAVGPMMTRMVGATADGLVVHPLTSADVLDMHTLPLLAEGAARADRAVDDLTVVVNVICCLHEDGDDDGRRAAMDMARATIGFYGSTPAYRVLLDVHGHGDLQPRLHALVREGRWADLPSTIEDDVVTTFALVGTPGEVATTIGDRFSGRADRVAVMARHGGEDLFARLVQHCTEAEHADRP